MSRSLCRPGTGRPPGSVLIAVAAWLLALMGGGALFVSFSAQYAYLLAVRRQDAASVIEALLLDLGMIVFTLLALGLARHLTDEAALERERNAAQACACPCASKVNLLKADREVSPLKPGELYAKVVERRFTTPNRCC